MVIWIVGEFHNFGCGDFIFAFSPTRPSVHHVCSFLTLIPEVFFQYSEHPNRIQAVSAILAGVWNIWLWDLTAGGPPVCVIIKSLDIRFWTDLAPIPPLGMSLNQGGFVLWKRWKENIGETSSDNYYTLFSFCLHSATPVIPHAPGWDHGPRMTDRPCRIQSGSRICLCQILGTCWMDQWTEIK